MKKITVFIFILTVLVKTNGQNVGIGTPTPTAMLDVNSSIGFTSKFNANSNQMYIGFYENNILRGYWGSYAGAAEDVDYGTASGNSTGKLHFTIQASPKMTIDNSGNVGIGTTSPSALLDINSTTKGILIPRMTSAQRSAVVSPANGLMVYDITTNSFWYYNSSAWTQLNDGGGSFSLPYAGSDASAESFKITNSLSGGIAVYGKATNTNPNSVGVLGEGTGGSSVGVRAKNTSGYAIYADATPTAALSPVIYGLSNSATMGVGVFGESNGVSGKGVYGETLAGIGVEGYANNAGSIAVKGNSLAGTGVKAYSFSGTALDVEGNLKIAGGNTNPTAGGILTSDASGNAVWKKSKVGFVSLNTSNSTSLNDYVWTYITGLNEIYDAGNDFNPTGSPTDPDTFIAPVSGFYQLCGSYNLFYSSSIYNIENCELRFVINGTAGLEHNQYGTWNSSATSFSGIDISELIHLNAGDKVKVQARQSNDGDAAIGFYDKRFSGTLLFAD